MPRTASVSWRRVVTEGLVIVASILLAFAIDAGWDARVERRVAVASLENLRTEIADNIAAIDSTVVRNLRILTVVGEMAGSGGGDTATADRAALVDRWEAIGGFLALQPEQGALNSLLVSGALLALVDEGLRSELAGLPQAWDEVMEDGDIARSLWVESAREMVAAAGPSALMEVAADSADTATMREALLALGASEDFLEVAVTASIFTAIYVDELSGLRDRLATLAESVDREIGR